MPQQKHWPLLEWSWGRQQRSNLNGLAVRRQHAEEGHPTGEVCRMSTRMDMDHIPQRPRLWPPRSGLWQPRRWR